MEKFVVNGQTRLDGKIAIAGAKNVALKALVASLLTDEPLIINNVPQIRDVHLMLEVLKSIGVAGAIENNTVRIKNGTTKETTVPLEVGARLRTSSMVLGPMLSRYGSARIPNPGGCRIGARPIDRQVDGLKAMGATIEYNSHDGFFYARAERLHGANFTFAKNTHTGTETLILAAVLAEGRTVLENAAEEVEIDDLVAFLNAMGAHIERKAPRTVVIDGVDKLHGATYSIMPDRNEEVTFAVAAAASDGDLTVSGSQREHLGAFLEPFVEAGGGMEKVDATTTRYFRKRELTAVDVVTRQHPGFMTDWQAPWGLLMTQAKGISTIHETVFENRFSYVTELCKMGAEISYFDPVVETPETFYNFNWSDHVEGAHQAISITGPTPLHNAILTMSDLRAGATVLLAAIIASGTSTIYGTEQIDRGYEHIESRLSAVGADITRVTEDGLSG